MANKVSILSTVLLDQPLIDKAAEQDMELDTLSFIHIDAITEKCLQEQVAALCTQPITAVFTSANSVRAIAEIIDRTQPQWNIYCIAGATKNAVLEYFDAALIKGFANDAARLAGLIQAYQVTEVVFFCGDKRMDTLPELLTANNVVVREVVVYKTTEALQVVKQGYEGILFFSPSGVDSFFTVNTIDADTVLFAIGNTTATALKQKTANKVIVSETPSKEQLVADAIDYFINSSDK